MTFSRGPVQATSRALGSLLLLASAAAGCFSERSFVIDPQAAVRLRPDDPARAAESADTRRWLTTAHRQLEHLLPRASASETLLTEQLADETGQPVEVFDHFNLHPPDLRKLLFNFYGLQFTAQAVGRTAYIDQPAPAWPGFEDVWIPIHEELALSGRLGYARDAQGQPRRADCIVILPGLFGDNGILRTRDLAIALRAWGYHVLALELRGHGQTEARYPKIYFTMGVLETNDLMLVSDWLEALPQIHRTGLIGYCWGANLSLLAAWYDGRRPNDPSIPPVLSPYLSPPVSRRRFSAGVIAFSPVLRFEKLADALDQPHGFLADPIYASFQDTLRKRKVRKNHPEVSGKLYKMVESEFQGYDPPLANSADEGYTFLRFLPYKDKLVTHKLALTRTPVLIVHGANDPLAPAQDVADLLATVDNPKVAAIILPSGGHVGFCAYANRYTFSLIANFFDPTVGAAALSP